MTDPTAGFFDPAFDAAFGTVARPEPRPPLTPGGSTAPPGEGRDGPAVCPFPVDLVVLDANNLAHRAWWAFGGMKTVLGRPCEIEHGLSRFVRDAVAFCPGAEIRLAWDGRPSRGLAVFPQVQGEDGKWSGYKAGRLNRKEGDEDAKPADWGERLRAARDALAGGFRAHWHPEEEADEQMARAAAHAAAAGRSVLLVSSDKDLHQLVGERVRVADRPRYAVPLDADAVEARWGVPPARLAWLRALSGDSSDSLPGIYRALTRDKVRLVLTAESWADVWRRLEGGFFGEAKAGKERAAKWLSFRDACEKNLRIMDLSIPVGPPAELAPAADGGAGFRHWCRMHDEEPLVEAAEAAGRGRTWN